MKAIAMISPETRFPVGLTYHSESVVRRAFKGSLPKGTLFWIEAAPGATMGMPDLFVSAGRGVLVPIELKCSSVHSKKSESGTLVSGTWKVELRPAQRRVIFDLSRVGAVPLIVIGDKGGDMLWVVSGKDAVGSQLYEAKGQVNVIPLKKWMDIDLLLRKAGIRP